MSDTEISNSNFSGALVANFKRFVDHFKNFNFGNFGTYFVFLLLVGIASLIVALIWLKVGSIFGGERWDFDFDDLQSYIYYSKSSNVVKTTGILFVGLLGLMLKNMEPGAKVNINSLFSALTPGVWRNFGILLGILLFLSLFVSEDRGFNALYAYDLAWSEYQYLEGGFRLKWWIREFIYLGFTLITFYFAALLVQIGEGRFTLLPAGRMPQVWAGMLMLLTFFHLIDRFTNIVTYQITSFVGTTTESERLMVLLALVISVFIATVCIGAKARILGENEDLNADISDSGMDEVEILDDFV